MIKLEEKDLASYQRRFYVYAYLDPRKHGRYTYEGLDVCFLYEPFYIGKGQGNRIDAHLRNSMLSKRSLKNSKLKAILSKGISPIPIKFKENLFNEQAIHLEIKLIRTIGRILLNDGPLTNLTGGGEGNSGWVMKDSTRKKIGETSKGRIHSDETRKSISKHLKGRKLSKSHCNIISQRQLGRKGSGYEYTDEIRTNISRSQMGREHSEETKEKIRLGGNLGKKISKETKKKISESLKKTWKFVSPTKQEFIFKGVPIDFCVENKLSKTSIEKYCKKGKNYRGWFIIQLKQS